MRYDAIRNEIVISPEVMPDIRSVVKEVFDEELKPLYVEREQHYQVHM